jgi:hypothetical protein
VALFEGDRRGAIDNVLDGRDELWGNEKSGSDVLGPATLSFDANDAGLLPGN